MREISKKAIDMVMGSKRKMVDINILETGKEVKSVGMVRSNTKTKIIIKEIGKITYSTGKAYILKKIIASMRVSLKMANTMVKELGHTKMEIAMKENSSKVRSMDRANTIGNKRTNSRTTTMALGKKTVRKVMARR
jgi:hypothetical protein